MGYAAETFASAEEYLQSNRAADTACLISDAQMPGMNGADLQDRLIADGHRMPIIFVTCVYRKPYPCLLSEESAKLAR
jgi:FixJ family two-component response regulator